MPHMFYDLLIAQQCYKDASQLFLNVISENMSVVALDAMQISYHQIRYPAWQKHNVTTIFFYLRFCINDKFKCNES